MSLITILDEDGFCEDGGSTTGLSVESYASFDMTLSVEGSVDDDDHSFYNRKLVVWTCHYPTLLTVSAYSL